GAAEGGRAGHVRADVVASDDRPGGTEHDDATRVTGDEVARSGGRAADRVPARSVDSDAIEVTERTGTRSVRPDVVPGDSIRGRAVDQDARRASGDHIAGARRRTADGVPARAGLDAYIVKHVRNCGAARGVRPDVVARDGVACRPGAVDGDACASILLLLPLPEIRLRAPAVD